MLKNSLPSIPLLQNVSDYARKWSEAGAQPVYDAAFASAIGGYPAGSVLQSADGSGFWISTADNNQSDPDGAAPSNWEPHVFHGVATIAVGAVDVVLKPKDYAKPNLVISGALSADVAVVLPSLVRQWVIQNEAVGAHQVTVKTASGQGVVLRPGSQMVWGDGSNILLVTPFPAVSGAEGHYAQWSSDGGLKDSQQSASNGSNAYVVTSPGALPVGHIAKIADANGSIGDGGVLGSVAGMNASNASNAYAVTSPGSLPVGHIAKIADTNGSIGDGGVLGSAAGLNASSVVAGAGLSSVYSFSGNPNGHVAGQAAVVGVSPPDLCWDTVERILWTCTLSGTAANAVWQKVGGADPVVPLSADHVVSTQDHSVNFVATAAVSMTLPQANSITNGACAFSLSAQGGAVTITPAAADILIIGSSVQNPGRPYVLPQGSTAFVVCDGAANWYLLGGVSQGSSFRNLLINGDCRVRQRGDTSYGTPGLYIYGGADRIAFFASHGYSSVLGTISGKSDGALGPTFGSYQSFSGSASGSGYVSFVQRVESNNCRHLSGKKVTISGLVYHDVGSEIPACIAFYGSSDRDVWNQANPIGAVYYGKASSGTWSRISATFTVGLADAENGLQVEFLFPVESFSNKTFAVSDLQLEIGSCATEFEVVPYEVQLQRCLRYFCKSYDTNVAPGTATLTGQVFYDQNYLQLAVGLTSGSSVAFARPMRTIPTLTVYSGATGAGGKMRDLFNGFDITPIIADICAGSFCWQAVGNVNATRVTWGFQYKAEAEL